MPQTLSKQKTIINVWISEATRIELEKYATDNLRSEGIVVELALKYLFSSGKRIVNIEKIKDKKVGLSIRLHQWLIDKLPKAGLPGPGTDVSRGDIVDYALNKFFAKAKKISK